MEAGKADPGGGRPLTNPSRRAAPALATLAALLLLPSLFYPFARDQGVFAYAGQVILHGGLPYRDVWDLKPPGVYYTYAAMLALTGSHMIGVRALDIAAAVTTVLLLYSLLRRLVGIEAAGLGALLYAALYLHLGFWGMAQAESYANLWTAASLAAWLGLTGPSRRFVLLAAAAGLAAASSLLMKVTALPPLALALVIVTFLRGRAAGWKSEMAAAAGLAVGLLLPLVIVIGWMAHSGTGQAYLDIQRGFVEGYIRMTSQGSGTAAEGWRYFWRLYAIPTVVALFGLLAASRPARLLLGTWLVAALVSVWMQGKYFGYHWTPVLLPLAGLAGTGLAAVLALVQRPSPGSWRMALGGVLIATWSMARPANGYADTMRLLAGRERLQAYWIRFGRPYHGDFSFIADTWAAGYISRHTRAADPVYIWGFEPLTLFLARRQAPTRFVFAVPLVSPWTPARWRDELMRDLRARPPVLFGVMRHDAIPHASGRGDDSAAQLAGFPALRAFLGENYRYETMIEDLTLYRRRELVSARHSERASSR
jgi:hypothetical protein